MYSLIIGLYRHFFNPPTFKILLIGMDGSGKTTLLNKLKQIGRMEHIAFEKIRGTIGLNLAQIKYSSSQSNDLWSKQYEALYWDLGGSKSCRNIWKKYYWECHAIIFMIDGSNRTRDNELQMCFEEFITDVSHESVPILILINNMGKDNIDSNYIAQLLKLDQYDKDRQVQVQLIDVMNNQQVISSVKGLHTKIEHLFNVYN